MTHGQKKLAAFIAGRPDLFASELARRLGVARSTISQWVNGSRRPGRKNASDLESFSDGVVPSSSWDVAVERPLPQPQRQRSRRSRRRTSSAGAA